MNEHLIGQNGAPAVVPAPAAPAPTGAAPAPAMGRRRFLRVAAAGAAATVAAASIPSVLKPLANAAESANDLDAAPERVAPGPAVFVNGEPEHDKVARTVCAPNCVGSCGIKAFVKDDVIVKVEAADFPDKAYNRICLRGISNAMQRVYSPDRVKYPMRRVGERGSGEFERIGWDEALELIRDTMQYNMDTYGPASNAFIGMTGNYGVVPQVMNAMLANTYDGTQFTNFGIMGDLGVNLGFLPTLGVHQDASSWEDLRGAKCILMFGCNYSETNMQEMHFVFDAQDAGAKLVVVDPRFSRTASKADWWVPIRPGTDAALAMGMMRHIVEQGRVDEGYVRAYTNGAFLVDAGTGKLVMQDGAYLVWDEAAGAAAPVAPMPDENKPAYPSVEVYGEVPAACDVPAGAALYGSYQVEVDGRQVEAKPAFQLLVESLEPWTPEQASSVCEVPAEDIVKLADLYTLETPCNLRVSQGTNRYWNGHLPTRALIQMAAITGNIGKRHANINWAGGTLMRFLFSLTAGAVLPREGHFCSTLPGTQWMDLVAKQEPYPIKFLWTQNYGWGTQGPEWNRLVEDVLPQLDMVVVSEQVMTPGAMYADLVLPVTSYYEEPFEIVTSWSNMYMQARQQAISPMWEAKTDYEIAQALADKFGILEETEWKLDCVEFARRHIIAENAIPEFSTIDFDELLEKGVVRANFKEDYVAFESMRFNTPSGKIELYTDALVEHGEQLACFYEPFEGNRSEKAATYPLTFMNCRTVYTTHSQHVQLPWIREMVPEPWLEMSPGDAAERGVETGDVVRVFNDRGEYRVKALVTPEIKPGCVNQRQGWWPKDFPDGRHYGGLLHMELNPAQDAIMETNFAPYDNLVQIEKA